MNTLRKITRSQWAKEHDRCFVCGTRWALESHEIVRGCLRQVGLKLPACWLRLCPQHHIEVEGWPVAKQLALKKLCDSEFYDRIAVNLARGRAEEAITEEQVDAYLEDLP